MRRIEVLTYTSGQMCGALRDSDWAMILFGYTKERRCSFWQFIHSNCVPCIRTGHRKIQFSEAAVLDWLASRSSSGR